MSVRRTARIGLHSSLLVALAVAAAGCYGDESREAITSEQEPISPDTSTFPATAAREWMVNLANSCKFDTISPPVAARTYTYGAIYMYEAVVHGMPGYRSLAGQLNGLDSLPEPDPGLQYDWPTVLAQTMHRLGSELKNGVYVYPNRLFYEYTTPVQASLTTLGPVQIAYRQAAGVPSDVIQNSIDYANSLADALNAWAFADGYYAVRYKGFVPPTGVDKWVPTGFSDTDKVSNPLEPYFGTIRPLVMHTSDECAPGAPVPFSTDPTSDFYAQAMTDYNVSQALTYDQRIIVNFWADGPGATATPAGHWLALATKFLRSRNLADATAGYAFTSLAYYDAFVGIWQSKYVYNLLRPETYIRRYINSGWRTEIPTPEFPTYVSGHSGVSGASADLFTAWFGDVSFTDDTKVRRGFSPRSFAHFADAAQEAANSRLYGGIHFPMDNQNGLTLGQCVANLVESRVHLTM